MEGAGIGKIIQLKINKEIKKIKDKYNVAPPAIYLK